MRTLIPLALLLLSACAPIQRPGTTLPPAASVSQTAPTGIMALDTLVGTILMRDEAALAQRTHLTTFACTTAEGLGGPPKCAPGVADGTPVDVIPVLESHAAYPTTLSLDFGPLVAIYRVPADTPLPEPDWPPGDYALLYLTSHPQGAITLYTNADGNIVRATAHTLTNNDPLQVVPSDAEILYQME